ncbi:MAG: hypothetical protein IPO19_09015 [Rhodoferax sp.]|nr:hypothetical protein [Rhodoferax sp.]
MRDDIGNAEVGDGALYKGRGFVQLTGSPTIFRLARNLESICATTLTSPMTRKQLRRYWQSPEAAIRTALMTNNLALARKKVNGGSHGLHEFTQSFAAGRKYLGIVVPQKAKAATNVKVTRK